MHSNVLEGMRRRPLYYTTHRQQAAMFEPVGAWNRGPAYGERNGPAIALFGAYASISAGVTLMATSTFLGGLMIAGGVMSGLGALTGNKTLSTLGMVASMGAGVGQFFSSGAAEQMWGGASMDDVGNTFMGTTSGATGVGGEFPSDMGAGLTAEQAAAMPGGASQTVGGMQSVGGQIANASGSGIMSSARPVAQVYEGAADAAAAGTAGQQAATTAATAAVPTATQSPMLGLGVTQTGESSSALGQVIGGKFVPNDTSGGGGLIGSAKKLWDSSSDLTKYGALQMVSGGVSGAMQAGATDRKTEAEQGLVDAKTGESKAMTTLAEKKAAGPSVPGVTMKTNPNAKIYGENADRSIRTQAQYVAAWRNAYKLA